MPFRERPGSPGFILGSPSGGAPAGESPQPDDYGFDPNNDPAYYAPGHVWVKVPPGPPEYVGGPPTGGGWQQVSIPQWASEGEDGGAGSQLSYQLGQAELAERIRANKAQEAAMARQRALDAATSAISAYLRGTELADARRLSSFQESRNLLPFLVDPGQEFFAGHEPGGALATVAGRYDIPFTPTRIQHKELVPASLATPPGNAQIGQGVLDEMERVRQEGNRPA